MEAIFLKQLRLIISKPYAMFAIAQNLNNLNNSFKHKIFKHKLTKLNLC